MVSIQTKSFGKDFGRYLESGRASVLDLGDFLLFSRAGDVHALPLNSNLPLPRGALSQDVRSPPHRTFRDAAHHRPGPARLRRPAPHGGTWQPFPITRQYLQFK